MLPLFLLLLALAGCFREEYGFCPAPYNVTLRYRLPDGAGGDAFRQNISRVTAAVYDQSGALVQTVSTTDTDHASFQGIRLNLDPGTYRVIAWGNAGANTVLNNIMGTYTDGATTVTYNNLLTGTVGNGDPVYYAPSTVQTRSGNADGEFVITLADGESYEGTIDFRSAYRHVEVFVKGFESNGVTTPTVELTGLPPGLTFLGMDPITGAILVTSRIDTQSVTVDEGGVNVTYSLAAFDIFYLDLADYDIGINVIDPNTGHIVYTTKMNDHIDPDSDDPDKIVIRIKIEFLNGIVTVTIPGWNSGDVDWGFFD